MALRVFCLSLLMTGSALLAAQQPSFKRVDQWVSQGRFADAAADLEEIAVKAGRSPKPPAPGEAKLLRDVIQAARAALKDKSVRGEHRSAARHVLCMSRAWFPDEELEGIENALRVGGGIRRPELIGKIDPEYTKSAKRTKIMGTVVVETLIDQEGCSRHPRVLKGLPMGLDAAALAAVRNWTFEPAMLDGRVVAVYYTLTVSFPARDDEAGVGKVKFRREGKERPTITNKPPGS